MAASETTVTNLVINIHRTKESYEEHLANGDLKDGEMQIFPEDEIKEMSSSELLDIWNSVMND